ncbi:DUF4157 domain-containing protein [Pedobacter sp. PAMC26386]|nr:DUF4157 domain-containing protein [Pedobacter sp. PAMC26386]
MNTYADKPKENKSQSIANGVSQNQSGETTFQFIDNRPEAIAQRKLQKLANNSLQVQKAAQLQIMANNYSSKQQSIQKKENNTGLPDSLKSGIENLSGYSMDDIKVHRNSSKPAQLQAHAYAQGTDIHVSSGQEKHLAHEAWHVVQQKQGRVKPTIQMQGKVNVNDDPGLEKEADVMGNMALQMKSKVDKSIQHEAEGEKGNRLEATAQPDTIQMRHIVDLVAAPRLNINTYSSEAPIQRTLNVGGAVIPAGGALPLVATTIINAIGELITQNGITTVITGWRGDETVRIHGDWATAIANAFFESVGWAPGDVTITNPALTRGNCHGLTFGGGGDDMINFDSIQDVLARWNNGPRILICLLNGNVAHTATYAGNWRQTLPYGPIFTSTRAVLMNRYACYDTGIPAELVTLQALGATAAAAAAAAAAAIAVAALIGPHILRLQAAIAIPEDQREGEDYYGYVDNWLLEAQGGNMTADEINNHNADLDDMGCP